MMPNSNRQIQDIGSTDGDDKVDIISKLPDEVLCHVLSFLHIKDVVRTSVLSKRWEYAWTSVPCLDFSHNRSDDDTETKLACYKNFVDRVLYHHRGSTVQKCTFNCWSYRLSSTIQDWISSVVACNVREFYFTDDIGGEPCLPSSLFTCRTLEVLKITGEVVLSLPSDVCLPSLKTLSLKYVIYRDDFSMQTLLSSCPVLEVLEIERGRTCHWDGLLTTSIYVPSLRRLIIYSGFHSQAVERYGQSVLIDAPCLEYLQISDSTVDNYAIIFFNSLDEVRIDGSCASKIVNQISHVKVLSLEKGGMLNLSYQCISIIPVFQNLKSLRLAFYADICDEFMSFLLLRCPNLEVLYLTTGVGYYLLDEGRVPWRPEESPPACLGKLKRVEIHDFFGSLHERSLVRYMLENAVVLEKMLVYMEIPAFFNSDQKMQILSAGSEILDYRRSSRTCRVVVYPRTSEYY